MYIPWSYEERFYGGFNENSESKLHTSCIYLERLSFHLYMQPKIISKCISLMTSKRQRPIDNQTLEIW